MNRLSLSLKKILNYKIIKSPQKKLNNNFEIKMPNKDGSQYIWEKKNYIKYLGVLINNTYLMEIPHLSHPLENLQKYRDFS